MFLVFSIAQKTLQDIYNFWDGGGGGWVIKYIELCTSNSLLGDI
jgi:hypothetical protein